MAVTHECDTRLSSFIRTFTNELQFHKFSGKPSLRRQYERVSKRAVYSESLAKIEGRTIDKFIDVCREVQITNVTIDGDVVLYARAFIDNCLRSANYRNGLYDQYGKSDSHVNTTYTLSHWKFGPGASNGVKGTHFYDKLGKLTVTSRASRLASLLIKLNPYLHQIGDGFKVVEGSKMSVVPKNESIGRTVCSEPSLNMAMQLSLGNQISDGLSCIGIDLSNQQTKNAALALRQPGEEPAA
jgi:hypothetical protein